MDFIGNQRIGNFEDLKVKLMEFDDIVFAYIFGSVARGEVHRFSDLDVAIYLKCSSVSKLMDIVKRIPDMCVNLDIRMLNDSPPLFRYNVIKHGILLFCRDKDVHEEFVYRTLVEALEIKEDIEKVVREKFEAIIVAGQ